MLIPSALMAPSETPGGCLMHTAKIVSPGASQQVTWYFGDLMEVSDRFVTGGCDAQPDARSSRISAATRAAP